MCSHLRAPPFDAHHQTAAHPRPVLQVRTKLRGQQQQAELLVHPDASIYAQLQLELQHAGLVVTAHFGGEPILRGDSFEDCGMEDGAMISVSARTRLN